PTHVNAVGVFGSARTRSGFLETATAPVLQSKTVADVINTSQTVAEQLMRLDIYEHVQVVLENAADNDVLAVPNSINVMYHTKEKSRLCIKTGTQIGNNEGNMNASITLRNVFGGAELLESSASFGTRHSSAFQFALSRPINASPDSTVDINAHHVLQNNTAMSSYEELARGALSRLGYHEVNYQCTWRHIDKIADTASLSIRHQAGHTLKSSLSHTLVRERRDDPLLPTQGYYVRCTNEVAGVMGLGNQQFVKNEVEAQQHHTVTGKTVVSLGIKAGWLVNLSQQHPTSVSDRFYVGGPLSVRGFSTGGIGPHDYKDALGGDAYWSAGVSVLTPLPRWEDKPVRAHAFLNGGSCVPVTGKGREGKGEENGLIFNSLSLTASPSIATGVGLVYRHSIARIELNYCIPLTAAKGDHVRRGLQLGIGLSFL
ncbi:surface antigen-domain-containing protein, partial [Spinellus fusiger]